MSGNFPYQSASSPTQRNFFTQALVALTHPRINATPASSGFPQSVSGLGNSTIQNSSVPVSKPDASFHIQMFPHTENLSNYHTTHIGFNFSPVEKDISAGTIIKIGRKVEKEKSKQKKKSENQNNVEVDQSNIDAVIGEFMVDDPDNMDIDGVHGSTSTVPEIKHDFIAFRSKVVSRTHAEMWVSKEGQVFLKDVGSSSGTFVNRQRLSVSGKESKPYALKSGDVIQLGVDYQGRQEEIYKCVLIKIFISPRTGKKPKPNYGRVKASLRALLAAMNPNATSPSEPSATDCCICLCSMSPYQALFLAPCSHCYHYKCVLPILGTGIMFPCPLCRQVANLDANVTEAVDEEDEYDEMSLERKGDEEWEKLASGFLLQNIHANHLAKQIEEMSNRSAVLKSSSESDAAPMMEDEEFEETVNKGINGGITLARPSGSSNRNMDIPKQRYTNIDSSPATPISIGSHIPAEVVASSSDEGLPETQNHTPEELNSAVIANTGAALDGLAQTLANGDPLAATSVLEGYSAMMEDLFDAFPSAFSESRKVSLRDTVQQQRRRFEMWDREEHENVVEVEESEESEEEKEKGKERV